jgi:hypothetical protein
MASLKARAQDGEFPAICEACNDPEIQRWLPLPSPYDLKDAQFFVNEFAESDIGQFPPIEEMAI